MMKGKTALVLLMLAAGGCGVYSANSGRVDESLKRVAVEYLENQTSEPNIEVILTDLITSEIQKDNTLKVTDEQSADSTITGRVVRYSLSEVAARQDLTVNEYQVQIAVALTMTRRQDGQKIFDAKRFTGSGNYVLNDGVTSESSAQEEAVKEIVRDILAMVVEDW